VEERGGEERNVKEERPGRDVAGWGGRRWNGTRGDEMGG